jgi:RNA polymerase sigma-70 factor (ECF subfamily)
MKREPDPALEASLAEDAALIERCRKGETAAFNEIVTKYRSKVYATIYNLTRNEQDAWDASQEAFLKAWRNLDRFRGDSSFFTWLFRIATNVAIDSMRRKQIESGVEFDETLGLQVEPASTTVPKAEPPPSRQLDSAEIRARIDAAIAQLSAEHRAVILLREVEGLQYDEIAQATGATVGTVMSRIFYARKKLQTLLRDVYETI